MAPTPGWKTPSSDELLHALSLPNIGVHEFISLDTPGVGIRLPVLLSLCNNLHVIDERKVRVWIRRKWHENWCEIRSLMLKKYNISDTISSTDELALDEMISVDLDDDLNDVGVTLNMCLKKEVWDTICPVLRGKVPRLKMQVGWAAAFAKALQCADAVRCCSLVGKNNDVSAEGIHCNMVCNNKSLTGVPCPLRVVISMKYCAVNNNFTATVFGEKNHNTIKWRQLREPERLQEALVCQTMKPSEREATLLSISGEILRCIPRKEQLRKAASEHNVAIRVFQDVLLALLYMHSQEPQYIRSIRCIPFQVILWGDNLLQAYHEVVKVSGRPNLFMDSTGGVIRKVYDQNRDIYLVAVVLQHPSNGEAQIPVALMITNSYGTPDYIGFLHSWWWSMLQYNAQTAKPQHNY